MDNAVFGEDIRLDNTSSGVARRDKLPGRIGGELEVFAGSGDVSGITQGRAIDGRPVDDLVPQNGPKLSFVPR